MHTYMSGLAKEEGLDYHFENAVVSNTMDAHRLLHFAKTKGLQSEAKEMLFKAYYTEGKDLNNLDVLTQIGVAAGLEADLIRQMYAGPDFRNDVILDQLKAQQNGIQGVPFFVFNQQYAISGAQPVTAFLQVLQQIAKEENADLRENAAGLSCGVEGIC
jgi:predicted DsbA family dithiol-disulfide isomerase